MSRRHGGGGTFQGRDVANTHVFCVRQGREYTVCRTSPRVRAQGSWGYGHIPVLLWKVALQGEGAARSPAVCAGGGTSSGDSSGTGRETRMQPHPGAVGVTEAPGVGFVRRRS